MYCMYYNCTQSACRTLLCWCSSLRSCLVCSICYCIFVILCRVIGCRDYYDILEVSKTGTELEIKKQYKRLALQLHPDKNNAPKADEAFKCTFVMLSLALDTTQLSFLFSPAACLPFLYNGHIIFKLPMCLYPPSSTT